MQSCRVSFFFSSRRRHTRFDCDWSSDVCSSDLVVGSVVQTMLIVAVTIGVALLVGFRPTATPVEWLAVAGVVVMVGFALTWLSVALGMVTKSVETGSNLSIPLVFLPFPGSGFVPTASKPGRTAR